MSIPVPRELDVDLTQVPRHWMAGAAVPTAVSNGINLLFPHGERFFVRSVHHFMDQIEDSELRAQVKAFFKQEGHHAKAHDDFNTVLRAHGFSLDRFLDRYHAVLTWLEARNPPKINLAATAAAEHFTAILAYGAFTRPMLDRADPAMRQLLAWHAAEEIEHKAVAFDVLQQVDDSYWLRVAGLAYATVTLTAFWIWGATTLLRQEKLGVREVLRQLRIMRQHDPLVRRVFVAGIKRYLRRDFHPSDVADEHLAARWFAAHGLPFIVAQHPEAA
jgi:predicted metal-dependent hydrolase